MKYLILIASTLIYSNSLAQSKSLQQLYIGAIQAHESDDDDQFYKLIMQAHQIHPHHQGILYQAGIAAALQGKPDESINFLTKAILIQTDFILNIPELKTLRALPAFSNLLKLQQNLNEVIIKSDTFALLIDRNLHLEGIDIDNNSGMLYGGSIHYRKIVQFKNNIVKDFIKSGQDGIGAVFNVKVYEKKLWATSSPTPEMINYDASLSAAVFQYDLISGKLIKKYFPRNTYLNYVFGDLTFNHKGIAFVSDSKNNFIFQVDEETGVLEQYYSSEEFSNIQGITFSSDGKFLFIADYILGVFRLDIEKMKLDRIINPLAMSTKGIDGLLYYENSLVAIQNGVKPMRVVQYFLNASQNQFINYKVIDQNHPAFNEPTNGCIFNGELYYIANSQWSGYNDQHQPKQSNELHDIVILKQNLD